MANRRIFVTADNHWGHANIVKFCKDDGSKIRPWDTLEDMHQAFVERWNATVNEEDLVYCLGDWCLGNRKENVPKWTRALKGSKILIMGNHDTAPASLYLESGFQDLKACHIFENKAIILSHIPVHERQFDRWKLNIHGHLHHDSVMRQHVVYREHENTTSFYTEVVDERYICVSVEQTDFKPILLNEVIAKAGL